MSPNIEVKKTKGENDFKLYSYNLRLDTFDVTLYNLKETDFQFLSALQAAWTDKKGKFVSKDIVVNTSPVLITTLQDKVTKNPKGDITVTFGVRIYPAVELVPADGGKAIFRSKVQNYSGLSTFIMKKILTGFSSDEASNPDFFGLTPLKALIKLKEVVRPNADHRELCNAAFDSAIVLLMQVDSNLLASLSFGEDRSDFAFKL